jgi:hypothetical protein
MATSPNRARGRPSERSERWYALLALLYLWSVKAARDPTLIKRRRGYGQVTTGRRLAAEAAELRSESSVTNALRRAEQEYGVFTRNRLPLFGTPLPRSRTGPYDRVTIRGLRVLGRAPEDWRKQVGPVWGAPIIQERAVAAFRILRRELRAERERRANELRAERERRTGAP